MQQIFNFLKNLNDKDINLSMLQCILLDNALRKRIAIELGVEEAAINFNQDSQFEDVKLIIQPKYDEYSIRARWLHDFLECSLLISGFYDYHSKEYGFSQKIRHALSIFLYHS